LACNDTFPQHPTGGLYNKTEKRRKNFKTLACFPEIMSIDVGVWVSWNDCDEDVPEGSVGPVTAWYSDDRVKIDFPNGNWHFPIDELTVVETPAFARTGQGWRPQQSAYEAWMDMAHDKSHIEALRQDASLLDAEGQTEWNWMGAKDQPRCSIEAFALELFKYHTQGDEMVAETGGVEFKVAVTKGNSPFAFPHDEPALATATFLSSAGAPLVVFESRLADEKGDDERHHGAQGPPRSYVSYPVAGKHVSFFGDLYHGMPDQMRLEPFMSSEASGTEEAHFVLLVNLQTASSVCSSHRLSEDLANKMTNHTGICSAHPTIQKPIWLDRRGGRGEVHRLVGESTSLTAALPLGIMRQTIEAELLTHEFRMVNRR